MFHITEFTYNAFSSNVNVIPYEKFVFSGGEIQVKLSKSDFSRGANFLIMAHLRNANDIMELLLVTDAIRQASPFVTIDLEIPYLPYARQDRVCAPGEAFSLQVMANLINAQNYNSVTFWDVHNEDKTLQLFNNVVNEQANTFFIAEQRHIVIAPDKGAVNRAKLVAKWNENEVYFAEKVRNPNNGEITGLKIDCPHIGTNDFLMVDDICDGGRTFIELAKILKPLTTGKIELFVTHGIFSKGFEVFNGLIDKIYTANSFIPEDELPDFVTIV